MIPQAARWRVTVGPKSFDIERLAGTDKDGAPIWQKKAFFRTRLGLEAGLRSRGLPSSLMEGLPRHHPDSLAAAVRFNDPPKPRGRAAAKHGDEDDDE